MNEKLWICVLAGLVFLVILFLRASRSGTSTEKQTPADEKNGLRIIAAACDEIWMFFYRRPYPGLNELDAAELRNVFEGALLAITREDACGLYGHLKEKLKQSGDALQSEACALIIRELSRRFGCWRIVCLNPLFAPGGAKRGFSFKICFCLILRAIMTR